MIASQTPDLRFPTADDLPALLSLNNAHAVETGELTAAGLRALIAASFRVRMVAPAAALCIAFDQTAQYASPNFHWFRDRYPRFTYIDRVIVSPQARGRGLARALYADVIEAARGAGHTLLCCEVNTFPPNPGSEAFHAALGFHEVGRADLAGRGKRVKYLTLAI